MFGLFVARALPAAASRLIGALGFVHRRHAHTYRHK
jgi:hypothetical protein